MRLVVLIFLCLLFTAPARAEVIIRKDESVRVVASIKPLHSLVSAVMQGVGEPELIVDGGTSPHVFQMKPSQMKMLERAHVVFYIGPGYETFLTKPLSLLPATTQTVPMSAQHGMRLLAMRTGGDFEPHHHGDEHEEEHEHEHAHAAQDMHIWLDPQNAMVMTDVIAGTLSARYPKHKEAFEANAQSLRRKLQALRTEMEAKFTPIRGGKFIVFHDAYQYLEKPFGIHAVGSVVVNPESPPGAKHMAELKDKIRRLQVACVFREPQFDDRIVALVVRDTGAQQGTLDGLGAALPAGPELYFILMRQMAADMVRCLQ